MDKNFLAGVALAILLAAAAKGAWLHSRRPPKAATQADLALQASGGVVDCGNGYGMQARNIRIFNDPYRQGWETQSPLAALRFAEMIREFCAGETRL